MKRRTMLYTRILAFLISLIISLPALAGDTNSDLLAAAKEGDTATMKALLDKGAGVNTKDKVFGKTLIHWAVENRHNDMVELLIAQGADVNLVDEVNGWAPLHQAAQRDDKDMVELLIANGANVNAKDEVSGCGHRCTSRSCGATRRWWNCLSPKVLM
jgi:ankyrin repeat protein